ncbi:MAG: terminase large subunit domain-containing protein [Candidatus Thorarchaeota archaeon]
MRVRWNPNYKSGRHNLDKLEALKKSGWTNRELGILFYFPNKTEKDLTEEEISKANRAIDRVCDRYKVTRHKCKTQKIRDIQAINREKAIRARRQSDLGSRIKTLVDYDEREVSGFSELSDEQIIFYRDNPEKFAEECIIWNGNPLKLHPYQIEWLHDKSTRRICNKCRRIGMSFVAALEVFHHSLFHPETTSLFISINEERAKELLQYIYTFADSNPELFEGIFTKRDMDKAHLTTGSIIYSLPNSPSGVRGIPERRGINTYWDEAAHFRDDDAEKMMTSLMGNMARGGRLSLISTPFGQHGTFYEVYNNVKNKYPDYSRHEFPYTMCPDFTERAIEEAKRNNDPVTFRQEFCCEFVSSGDELFRLEDVMECVDDDLIDAKESESNNPFYVGADFAKRYDSTAIYVVERLDKTYIVRKSKCFDGRGQIDKVMPYMILLKERFSPSRIMCDYTGMGIKIVDDLQKELGSIVEGVTFTNPVKEKLIMNLWQLIIDQKVVIPHDRQLINQLIRLERGETVTGLPTYRHVKGQRDDRVWALALACSCNEGRWSGYVHFGQSAGDKIVEGLLNPQPQNLSVSVA